jgi:hypothetical protein
MRWTDVIGLAGLGMVVLGTLLLFPNSVDLMNWKYLLGGFVLWLMGFVSVVGWLLWRWLVRQPQGKAIPNQEPAALSKEQRVGIVDRLRKNRPHDVVLTFTAGDADASNFAHDLTQALHEGGWGVSGPSPGGYVPMAGVLVGVDDFTSPHPSARLLVDVLTAVGIRTRVVQAAVTGPDRCCLLIGGVANANRRQRAA